MSGISVGPVVTLDESWITDGGTYLTYNNYYPTGCRVFDDVALIAWNAQGTDPNIWEARAVRWRDDLVPELGPQAHLEHPLGKNYTGTISWVGRVSDGLAVIVAAEVWDNSPVMGWVVSVDPDTLAITYLGKVEVPTAWGTYYNNDMALVAEADGQLLIVGKNGASTATLGTVLLSVKPASGGGFAVTGRPVDDHTFPGYGSGDPGLWSSTEALVDMGAFFVRVAQYRPPGTSQVGIRIFSHPSTDGVPQGDGEVKVEIPSSIGWKSDAVYAARVSGTLVHIIEVAYSGQPYVYMHVLDTTTWQMTPVDPGLFVGRGWRGSSAHQMDWESIDWVQDSSTPTSLLAWSSPDGGAVGTYNGTTLDSLVATPWGTRVYAQYGWEAQYLSRGRFVTFGQYDEQNNHTPMLSYYAGVQLGLLPPVITGGPEAAARNFLA